MSPKSFTGWKTRPWTFALLFGALTELALGGWIVMSWESPHGCGDPTWAILMIIQFPGAIAGQVLIDHLGYPAALISTQSTVIFCTTTALIQIIVYTLLWRIFWWMMIRLNARDSRKSPTPPPLPNS